MIDEHKKQIAIAAGHLEEEPDGPMDRHLDDDFKLFADDKYHFPSQELKESPEILKLLHAVEWYELPKSSPVALIENHPDVT
jgi:hypothetical protein